MEVRQYLLGIVAMALICAIVRVFFPEKGTIGTVIKMLLGLAMLFAVISPLTSISLNGYYDWKDDITIDAQTIVAEAENSAKEQIRQRIIEQSQSYILAKAEALDAQVEIKVEVTDEAVAVPCTVTIIGAVSPYAKQAISRMLTDDLGIDREAQIWIS